MYLKCSKATLLFLQGYQFLPLIYFGERYASVGKGGDCNGEGAGPETMERHRELLQNKKLYRFAHKKDSVHFFL